MRWSIAGTTTAVVARCSEMPRRNVLGVEAAPADDLRAEGERDREVGEAERVEERRRDVGHLAGPERNPVEQGAERVDRPDLAARRALRRAGGPAGQHHDRRPHAARVDRRRRRGGDQLLERRLGAAGIAGVGPGPVVALGPLRRAVVVLLVEDERVDAARACRRRRSAARRTPCSCRRREARPWPRRRSRRRSRGGCGRGSRRCRRARSRPPSTRSPARSSARSTST